jgi:fatty acid desaturase
MDVRHLRAADRVGLGYTLLALAASGLGTWASVAGPLWLWAAGQLALGLAFVQWFVLLHECGHATLCRHRRLNTLIGHLSGLLALIPFDAWRRVHQRHHKWTGWQDLDPTTASLTPRPRSRIVTRVARVCWKYWIPIFALLYRVTNYWNPARLLMLFPGGDGRRLVAGAAAQAGAYVLAVWTIGPADAIRILGVALLIALVAQDVLLISQHTHMPLRLSNGDAVRPFVPVDQERFTRSLRLPRWLSWWTLHFDAHERHHMYPAVPGYRLLEVPYAAEHEVSWREWIPAARAVPGDVLLFQNREATGYDL